MQAETALAPGELKLRRLDPLSAEKTAPDRNIAIRVAEQDLARARDLAAKGGLRYQTYLNMLLHEALDSDRTAPEPAPLIFKLPRAWDLFSIRSCALAVVGTTACQRESGPCSLGSIPALPC